MSEATLQKNELERKQDLLTRINKSRMNVTLMRVDEASYRKYPALSYSRLSDIEQVGAAAVNASIGDISKLRGVMLGTIVDDVISNKLDKIPDYVKTVDKLPGPATITNLAINSMIEDLSFERLSDLEPADLQSYLESKKYMRNGMNSSNFWGKLVNYEQYTNKAIRYKNDPKTMIITRYDLSIVKLSIKRLRTQEMFRHDYCSPGEQLFYQMKFLGNIAGLEVKCMLDAIRIDHLNKKIYPIDIKTGVLDKPDRASFTHEAYLKYNYYIQSGLYRKMLIEYFKHVVKYQEYTVMPFTFVYSTTNPKTSMSTTDLFIHEISEAEYIDSFKGFSYLDVDGKVKNKAGIAELFNFYKDNLIVVSQ